MDISTRRPQNMIMIAVFYHVLLFIGYPILLGGFKLVDEVLDMLVMGAIFIGNGTDGNFILDDSHEC